MTSMSDPSAVDIIKRALEVLAKNTRMSPAEMMGTFGLSVEFISNKEDDMEQKTKKVGEDDAGFNADYKIPETKGTISRLQEALQGEHQKLMEAEDEKDKKDGKDKNRKRQRRGGVICICGDSRCRIGPMNETQGETTE